MWKNKGAMVVCRYLAGLDGKPIKPFGDASRFSHSYFNPALTETIDTIQIIVKL